MTGAGVGEIRAFAPGEITYNAARVASLTVNGGSGGNTFSVFGTATGRPTTLNAGSGIDTVKVCNFFDRTDDIRGPLEINGQGSQDALQVNDVNSFKSRVATLDVVGGLGTVTGMSPAAIAYAAADFATVSLRGSSSGNTFTVANTAANATTTLNSGFDVDTVNVLHTTGPLNIASTAGQDTVNIGLNRNTKGIQGAVRVSNGQITKLTVEDSADLQNRAATLALGDLVGTTGVITGLTPAPITYVVRDISTLTLNSGAGADTFEVGAASISPVFNDSININTGSGNDRINVRTIVAPRLSVDAGPGDDRIDVGSSTAPVGLIRRGVTVVGGDGNDTLNVIDGGTDQASSVVLDVSAGTGSIAGLAPGVIRFRGDDPS